MTVSPSIKFLKDEEPLRKESQIKKHLIEREAYFQLQICQNLFRHDRLKSLDFKDLLLVSIDVEQFEIRPNYLLEVGVSIFDFNCVKDGDPIDWKDSSKFVIASRHFIVKENQKLQNGKFVPANTDQFLYGRSEVLPEHMIAAELKSLLTRPSSLIWLIAHDTALEQKSLAFWLNLNLSSDYIWFDTLKMFNHLRPARSGLDLSSLCRLLGIVPECAHNAGNDAYYTLRAFMEIAMGNLGVVKEKYQ